MRGIKGIQLASVVDFMYQGEVNIAQEDLDDFLTVADELQLKGLTGNYQETNTENWQSPKPRKVPIAKTHKQNKNSQIIQTLDYAEPKTEERNFKSKALVAASIVQIQFF